MNTVFSFARRWRVFLIFGAIYLYCFPYFGALRNANELPRILTTMELARHGTFRLDRRMSDLGSVADVSTTPSGHHYQNKAPGLSIAALPVYSPLALLYRLVGREPPLALATWLLRVFVVAVPSIAFLRIFREVAERFALSGDARNGALVAYALGSMVLPYSILFMSHVPAAVLLGTAFALAARIGRGEARSPERTALAIGALLGAATFVEYQAILGASIIAGYAIAVARRRLRIAAAVGAAALPFVAMLALYHAELFGSPFRTGYAYSVDAANRVGFWGVVGPSKEGFSQLFIHVDNGILLLSPWVLLSAVGAVAIATNRDARARVGAEALVAVLVVAVYCLFVASLEPEFGRAGWSVGPRYIAVAMPFLAWLSAAGLDVCVPNPGLRVPAYALVLAGVVVHVIAATTYPHWPEDFKNPLFEISVRLLREGHAPHSLGTLVGLRGLSSLVPLYAAVLVFVAFLLAPTRQHLIEIGLAAVLAAFAVSRYGRLAVSPPEAVANMWAYVSSTLEP